jgi:thiol-disulfide isomerase/thioredoxin
MPALKFLLPLLTGILLAVSSAAVAADSAAPQVSISSASALPTPLPLPYDPNADAQAQLAAALTAAKADGRRVLLDFGGNWCPDCRVLAGIMELPEVKPWLDRHFVVVPIDVGRMDRNLDIPARYGVPKLRGVPHVLVLDTDGTPLNPLDTGELPNARNLKPQAVVDWLARWAKPAAG